MTKYDMVRFIMNTIEGKSCGYEGSKSYNETKKYLCKLTKQELYSNYRLLVDGENCNFSA